MGVACSSLDPATQLEKFKSLFDIGVIDADEYRDLKWKVLSDIVSK